ncbi:hypothetical protein, partial [Aureimonas pseudogalii]|uniref:hypothetical protein n=1 Tax=Aureimonas pseudogalii TaxID=1744844 RepID=UPI0035E55C17
PALAVPIVGAPGAKVADVEEQVMVTDGRADDTRIDTKSPEVRKLEDETVKLLPPPAPAMFPIWS